MTRRSTFVFCLLSMMILIVMPAYPQTQYDFTNEAVSGVSASSTSVAVTTNSGYTFHCAIEGVMGKMCSNISVGDIADFSGEFPASDSDMVVLGVHHLALSNLEFKDKTVETGTQKWKWEGCVNSATLSSDGLSYFITLEAPGSVFRNTLCDTDEGTLGDLCTNLTAGDCGVFYGKFPVATGDLYSSGLLTIEGMVSDNTVTTTSGGDGRECTDCDV